MQHVDSQRSLPQPSMLVGARAGTLAGASGHSVETLLDRVGNRRVKALAAKVSMTHVDASMFFCTLYVYMQLH